MTQSVDNSEAVMQGVLRDPVTGALLRINADGSINVSGTGGLVGTGTTITGAASITLNTAGIQFNGLALAGTATAVTGAASITLNSAGLSFNGSNLAGVGTSITGGAALTLNSAGLAFNGSGLAGTVTAITGNASITLNSAGLSFNGTGLAGTGVTTGTIVGTVAAATLNSAGLSFLNPEPLISSYQNITPLWQSTNFASLNASSRSVALAFAMPQNGSFSFLRAVVLMTTNSTTVASNATFTTGAGFCYTTWNAVVYSLGTGASSQSLISVASGSAAWTVMNSYSFSTANSAWSITQGITGSAYGTGITASSLNSQTTASANFSSGWATNFTTVRFLDINFAQSLSAGPFVLLLGLSSSSTTSGQGAANLTMPGPSFASLGVLTQASLLINAMNDTAAASGALMGAGVYGTAGGTTSIFPLANITTQANNYIYPFQLLRSA